jgi:hypothetical protein
MIIFKEKRQSKKRAKSFLIIAYGIMIMFIIIIIIGILYVSTYHKPIINPEKNLKLITFFLIFMGLPFLSIMFAMFSINNLNKRKIYLRNIREYRKRKFFLIVLDLIENNLIMKAIDYYNSIPQGKLKDYLFAILIYESRNSGDQKFVEEGKQKMREIKELYSPDKVNF